MFDCVHVLMVPVCYLPLPETGPQVCSLDLYRSPTLTLICGQIKLKSHCFESCGIRNNVDDFKIF